MSQLRCASTITSRHASNCRRGGRPSVVQVSGTEVWVGADAFIARQLIEGVGALHAESLIKA
jgi:hypothetical protein